jgi:hypothetical protein
MKHPAALQRRPSQPTHSHSSTAPHDWSRLLLTLLDFERSPGRYRVVLREPRPLFERIGSVMLLAAGRPVEGLPAASANAFELHRAARFFVRTVMLRPGSDPLTLLGLKPGFEPAQLREHYRLMIRLTHPDFEAASEGWPADAATRVNMAKDLLSSPEKRAVRPPSLVAPAAKAGAPVRPRAARPRPSPARDDERAGWRPPRAVLALAGTAAFLMAGALLLISLMGNKGSLAVHRVSVQDPVSLDGRPVSTQPMPGTPEREALPP